MAWQLASQKCQMDSQTKTSARRNASDFYTLKNKTLCDPGQDEKDIRGPKCPLIEPVMSSASANHNPAKFWS